MSGDENFAWKVLGALGASAIAAVTFSTNRPSEQERCRQDCMKAHMYDDKYKIQCFQLCQKDQDLEYFKNLQCSQKQREVKERCGPCRDY